MELVNNNREVIALERELAAMSRQHGLCEAQDIVYRIEIKTKMLELMALGFVYKVKEHAPHGVISPTLSDSIETLFSELQDLLNGLRMCIEPGE